ncbi:energy transducer TonB [Psychrobacter sp. AOP30-A2-5]|uniref:energy transducer TonB n=1 Tax=Psychrobacter sp. AOP30-A2-5 TaxID=3457697 RepID=UPI0040360EDF
MTHKSHTKLSFNTASTFFTNIKPIGIYGLLVTMFALFTMIVSTTPAQAEIVDLSSPEPIIQLSTLDASWLTPPKFDRLVRSMDRYLINCSYDQDGNVIRPCERTDLEMVFSLRVDKQGSIKNVKVIESSGVARIDKMAIRELYKARLKPFLIKGRAVEGNVTLPIEFK